MRHIYTFLLYCLIPFALLRLWWKSRHNRAYRVRIGERFAFQLPDKPNHDSLSSEPLWVHAVSVGEFLAIKPLLAHLLAKHATLILWITCTTPTGSEQIQQFAHDNPRVVHSYFPYDTPTILKRFIRHVQPRGIVLMETEIWPNLLTIAHHLGIPTTLINARLSAKSLRGYYKYARTLVQKPLQTLQINAQTRDDARRFHKLGARVEHIHITPNLKYHTNTTPLTDYTLPLRDASLDFAFIWLAASTHPGEDDIILHAHQLVQKTMGNSMLMIAPRHPERRENIVKAIQQAGFNAKLRSQDSFIDSSNDVYIIDTLGELKDFYPLAQAAFIGGSLINHGGHNPLEALQAGVPVCFGPSMFNFKAIAASLSNQPFAQQVEDAQSLYETLMRFRRENLRASIALFNEHNQDVLARHYHYIAEQIPLP